MAQFYELCSGLVKTYLGPQSTYYKVLTPANHINIWNFRRSWDKEISVVSKENILPCFTYTEWLCYFQLFKNTFIKNLSMPIQYVSSFSLRLCLPLFWAAVNKLLQRGIWAYMPYWARQRIKIGRVGEHTHPQNYRVPLVFLTCMPLLPGNKCQLFLPIFQDGFHYWFISNFSI
jgi:hypothetical protein